MTRKVIEWLLMFTGMDFVVLTITTGKTRYFLAVLSMMVIHVISIPFALTISPFSVSIVGWLSVIAIWVLLIHTLRKLIMYILPKSKNQT